MKDTTLYIIAFTLLSIWYYVGIKTYDYLLNRRKKELEERGLLSCSESADKEVNE